MRILHFFMFAVLIMIFRFIMLISVLLQAKNFKKQKNQKKCKLVIANFYLFCYNSGHGV